MATKSRILEAERSNENFIDLYREGVFLAAYERSCYAFHLLVRSDYRVIRKYMKSVDAEMVSIGFPATRLEEVVEGREVVATEWGFRVILRTDEIPPMEDFEEWKAQQEEYVPSEKKASKPAAKNDLAELIRNYPLENKTPMECMLFLYELKRQCQDPQTSS